MSFLSPVYDYVVSREVVVSTATHPPANGKAKFRRANRPAAINLLLTRPGKEKGPRRT